MFNYTINNLIDFCLCQLFQILVPCCLAVLFALAVAEGGDTSSNKESKVEQKEVEDTKGEQTRNQRGLYGSLGDYGHSSSDDDFGGHDFGASDHHHEHIKTVTIEKKVPVPYTVHKHIPYTGM